ncbi:ATP-binding cassette domain-containing protein [Candidatus Reidiella endopervernicosa]|uniref:ATP-binding cassette domain-containing protein n=1 Tax=Candidatus Reidiella endopervernicosa TaxID=2738883 RepID=A0A6N0HZJ1_9GAMM|nr:ATP-binding cassette domain-containing protein [Candidatus Reidiella endopervernicosa]QKQ27784.1 ATP-binding cassette domain-containing protein [Candidatus Reidiella endopervernicosa]
MVNDVTVSCRSLTKRYRQGDVEVHALDDLSLEIPQHDFACLSGPSGSGKSTLLNVIGGLDTPSSGEVYLSGQRLDTMSKGELADLRLNHR